MLFASNQAPDVIFINNLYLHLYANKLEPLNDVVNIEDFNSKSIEAMSIDGKLYAKFNRILTLVGHNYNVKHLIDDEEDI